MNNVGLAAHRLVAACPTASPKYSPLSREGDPPGGPDAFSCPGNGSCYRAKLHAIACRALGIRHIFTRAYRPQTNGKAERFTRTMLSGWAYGAIYRSSSERTRALDGWLHHYSRRFRPSPSSGA